MPILLEACVTSLDAARAALDLGADRLELCVRLDVGGLSPQIELIEAAGKEQLPARIMLRARSGSFACSDADLAHMLATLDAVHACGLKGAVCGCLLPSGSLDEAGIARITQAHPRMRFTFHRAIDAAADPLACAAALAAYPQFDRLLAAGSGSSRKERWDGVKQLAAHAKQTVVGCGGLRPAMLAPFIAATGVREVHFSAMGSSGRIDRRRMRGMAAAARAAV